MTGLRADDRAVSEVVGYVLLLGMVFAGMTSVIVFGGGLLTELTAQNEGQSVSMAFSELDVQMTSLTRGEAATRGEIRIGTEVGERADTKRDGNLTVSVNNQCTETLPLSSVRYATDDDRTVAYEAGGIFEVSQGDTAAILSPPDVTYANKTIDISLVNLTGQITGAETKVTKNLDTSNAATENVSDTLFDTNEDCGRPNTVRIRVESDFADAWEQHFRTEFDPDAGALTRPTDRVVELRLTEDDLPPEANDQRNEVVPEANLTVEGGTVSVDKQTGIEYDVYVEPLGSGPQVSRIESIPGDVTFREPIDVVFVIDESGSMSGSKMSNTKDAARSFVGLMNDTRDRAGVVGYDDEAEYLSESSQARYLTDDYDAVNTSIDGLSAGGSTNTEDGLRRGHALLDLEGTPSHERVAILLSDGEPTEGETDPDELERIAEEIGDDGVTVYTVGTGDADESLMMRIANATGGTYSYADDPADLQSVFREIFKTIAESNQIVRPPISVSYDVSGETYYPRIVGDSDHVANITKDGQTVRNVNDPAAPSQFSFTESVADGELTTLRPVTMDCAPEALELTNVVHSNGTKTYREVRCTEVETGTADPLGEATLTLYRDGDDVSSLLDEESAWWQDDFRNDTFDGLLHDNDTLDLKSNEVVAVMKYPDGDETYNRIAVLYRIGLPDEETRLDYIVDVTVTNVRLGK
ncbi:von Willebrand factor type A domain-containing protein [Haloferax mucosum ATCC BAA-1512]|uniref:von Willebrand factor type A domain-containing protein n=1 Tax=Haloferax mucosum ATCC BAA-1512 TaxID=662479 RepID=M0I5W9_9EURY|nr:VWA domain-containing protein [Haloferax mucosum]ELZ91413.1 von Willebrand factor type A domain-containing protein [Haloferax mucosum ATCC BAA-1512]